MKGIPPKEDDVWAKDANKKRTTDKVSLRMRVSVSNCIKLFVRPPSVKGHPDDVADQVKWQISGGKLKGINPTPFFINLSELKVGGKNVNKLHYIAPFSSYEYSFPVSMAGGKVQWQVITDYGGKSNIFETSLTR